MCVGSSDLDPFLQGPNQNCGFFLQDSQSCETVSLSSGNPFASGTRGSGLCPELLPHTSHLQRRVYISEDRYPLLAPRLLPSLLRTPECYTGCFSCSFFPGTLLHGRDSLGLGSLSLCVHPHIVSFGSSSWGLVWEYFPDLLACHCALYARLVRSWE